jgi:maleate isomerase
MAPSRKISFGIIVPSSNTLVEPTTYNILSNIHEPEWEVTVYFTRVRVTQISLSKDSDQQFTIDSMLAAAQLLADAKVNVIGWSGTAASWTGFDSDKQLCCEIKAKTGIPATTSTLAILDLCRSSPSGPGRLGLVTPYTEDVNAKIRDNYGSAGFPVSSQASKCCQLSVNHDFAAVSEQDIERMIGEVAAACDTVMLLCTNMGGARYTSQWEAKYKLTIFHPISTVIHAMFELLDLHPSSLERPWGSIFAYNKPLGSAENGA